MRRKGVSFSFTNLDTGRFGCLECPDNSSHQVLRILDQIGVRGQVIWGRGLDAGDDTQLGAEGGDILGLDEQLISKSGGWVENNHRAFSDARNISFVITFVKHVSQ